MWLRPAATLAALSRTTCSPSTWPWAVGFAEGSVGPGEFSIGLLKITEKGRGPTSSSAAGPTSRPANCALHWDIRTFPRSSPIAGRSFAWALLRSPPPRFGSRARCLLKVSGNSVFDLEGRLVGLTSGFPVSQGDHVHTSVEMIRTDWDDLVAGRTSTAKRLLSSETEAGESPKSSPLESPPAGDKDRIAAVIEKATLASVRVVRKAGEERGWSGTIVTADGYVITCGHHERLPGQRVTLYLSDGRDASAVILGTNLVPTSA